MSKNYWEISLVWGRSVTKKPHTLWRKLSLTSWIFTFFLCSCLSLCSIKGFVLTWCVPSFVTVATTLHLRTCTFSYRHRFSFVINLLSLRCRCCFLKTQICTVYIYSLSCLDYFTQVYCTINLSDLNAVPYVSIFVTYLSQLRKRQV